MCKVTQSFKGVVQDTTLFLSIGVSNEAHTTGIVLKFRIIKGVSNSREHRRNTVTLLKDSKPYFQASSHAMAFLNTHLARAKGSERKPKKIRQVKPPRAIE